MWGTVSSGFREIEIGWDRLESVGHVAPFVAPDRSPEQFRNFELSSALLSRDQQEQGVAKVFSPPTVSPLLRGWTWLGQMDAAKAGPLKPFHVVGE
jgi:hypothetical protein